MLKLELPLIAALCLWILSTICQAQNDESGNGSNQSFSRKQIEIARTTLVPEIDGILDDEIWRQATRISDMHQFLPEDHGEPTESSLFYITYSERYFYLAARLYDSDPSGISARQLIQGQGMPFDDAFEFILDTFNNGRTGYQFQINPNGIRREGVYENPNSLNRDWTGIWQVESRIDEEGWTAEVAIPFNTLNFDPDTEDWGFTIGRTIARKQEELAWSSFNRQLNPTTTGIISGIRNIRQGIGLDIIPSMTVGRQENFNTNVNNNDVDPSLNVFYKFTPNLTGALTLNTDFSATEVDNRQVNLTRFSLFFPEKRDFFLQDVDIFSFGGLSQNGIPFYSRRIGLSRSGQPVDIDAGVKLTGRVGRLNVGGLGVRQADNGAVNGSSLFVGRAAVNVLGESSIGGIITHGDPGSNSDNTLVGVDFRYQNTRFSDTHNLRSNNWYQQTDTEGITGNDEKAWGVGLSYSTQGTGISVDANYEYFGENFKPALGFANRQGTDHLVAGITGRLFLQNHSLIRSLDASLRAGYFRVKETGEMQQQLGQYRFLTINTHQGDQLGIGMSRSREGLINAFEISPGIVIPAGDYGWHNPYVQLNLAEQRDFSPFVRISGGDFYNGENKEVRTGFGWRPNANWFLDVDYRLQDIELPQGSFDIRQVSMNVNYAFNAKWSWINLVQYENRSNTFGLNSRLRWNPQAGEDLYLVINYNFDSEGVFSRISSETAEIVLKYTKTFRF